MTTWHHLVLRVLTLQPCRQRVPNLCVLLHMDLLLHIGRCLFRPIIRDVVVIEGIRWIFSF